MTTTLTRTEAAASRLQSSRLHLWSQFWRNLCLGWRRWHDARITRRALSALDDRMLKDIGVARWEIDSRVHRSADQRRGWWRP